MSEKSLQAAVGGKIDGLVSWRARYWIPIILGLVMLGDSYDNLVVAYTLPSLKIEWDLDTYTIGLVISAGYAGQVVGLVGLGPAAERFGRIPVFVTSIMIMSLLSILCAYAPTAQVFMLLRFIQGVAIGGAIPACTSYVNELAPTATRGRYFSIFQFLMVSGYSIASVAATFLVPAHGWRAMYLLGAAPAVLLPLVFFTLPESPRWLARKGRRDDANTALARLGSTPVARDLPSEDAPPAASPIKALLAPQHRRLTAIVSLQWFLTSLVGYTFATWIPTFYVQYFGLTVEQALHYSAIAGGIYLFAPLVFAMIIDRVGRRRPAITMSGASAILLLGLVAVDPAQTTVVVALITAAWVTAAAAVIILVPYTADIFPTSIRAAGMGFSTAFARAASMSTPMFVGATLGLSGTVKGVFLLLAAASAITAIVWMMLRETANLSLEEIDNR